MISRAQLLPQHQQNQQPFYSQALEVEHIDADTNNSIASSPHSTQSLLSQYSTFQSTPLPTTFEPTRFNYRAQLDDPSAQLANLSQVPDLMPSADMSWLPQLQQTPRGLHRLGHHRESSLSSMGSNGPASPYTANTSNPQIAVTDSADYNDMLGGGDGSNYSYQAAKSMNMTDGFYTGLHGLQAFNQKTSGAAHLVDAPFSDGLPRQDRNLLPAPELSGGSIGSSRSLPPSVASSIVGGDSPATPSLQEPIEDADRRRKNVFNHTSVPKLDRTMTDVYNDELYSPSFTITSASPQAHNLLAMSPSNELFNQRLQAANSQHLNATQSPMSASSRSSPFRQGSPYASAMNDFSGAVVHAGSAQQIREKRKAEQDAKMQQMMQSSSQQHQQPQQGTPSTISPKDAVLEFNEVDDGSSNFPLFSSQETSHFNLEQLGKSIPQALPSAYQPVTSAQVQSSFNFSMPSNVAVPQQYPFIARTQQPPHHQAMVHQPSSSATFSRVNSAESSASDASDGSLQKPGRANADSGTYTCTYHGCTLRFDTPALLQKHKREGHRQANALNAARASSVGALTGSVLNSQAGPHRCDRINPSTGKPCSTVFSRPYDLTRHEDTIHNARKQKVRCDLCTEEKTFSRADALTRHYRVCHPDVELPGKHRRRGGLSA